MTPIVEGAVLGSDLDGQFYSLLNVKSLDPVPPNLATADDARLTDVREPIPGSVTNVSVAADAAIDQSKLNLNGQIPTAWLGSVTGTAADGSLAEYASNKNQPGGYAGLDATGKIPSANLPDAVGLATVTSIGISLPPELRLATGDTNPITTSGTWHLEWIPLAAAAWFGTTAAGTPAFQSGPFPLSFIPNLDASQVVSGTFDPARMPVAHGVGGTHAIGAVPDPGDVGTGLVTDYLGRDMLWHTAPTIAVGYQTALPAPTLTVSPATGLRTVTPGYDPSVPANEPYQDATFFYSTTSAVAGFAEFPDVGYVQTSAATIWVYAAHPGYNNSPIVHNP